MSEDRKYESKGTQEPKYDSCSGDHQSGRTRLELSDLENIGYVVDKEVNEGNLAAAAFVVDNLPEGICDKSSLYLRIGEAYTRRADESKEVGRSSKILLKIAEIYFKKSGQNELYGEN